MNKIAIIPARGGSRRVPQKNIKEFLGKPIISYSIEAALKSKLFDTVMVSTDDSEIAEAAEKYGAEIPFFRSAENADDFAATADVLLEVIEEYGKRNISFDVICCIYPTAPFVSAEKLIGSNRLLGDYDAVVSITKFNFPVQRSFIIREKQLEYLYPEHRLSRSQDLEPIYHDAGQFYWIKTESLLKEKILIPEKSTGFVLSESEVQDIDTSEDWKLAELKYRAIIEKNSKS